MNKLEFPAPPKGREWHNPENYSPERIEIDKGWRLTLAGEERDNNEWEIDLHNGKGEEPLWKKDNGGSPILRWTYRTKAPLPSPKIEMSETQKNFENWAKATGWGVDLTKDEGRDYFSDETSLAWLAWKAANPIGENEPTEKPAPTWNRDVITMRIINSTDEENSHYYTVQVNEFGCVQLQSFSFDGGELLESFSMSPADSLLVAESLKFIADNEIEKEVF